MLRTVFCALWCHTWRLLFLYAKMQGGGGWMCVKQMSISCSFFLFVYILRVFFNGFAEDQKIKPKNFKERTHARTRTRATTLILIFTPKAFTAARARVASR